MQLGFINHFKIFLSFIVKTKYNLYKAIQLYIVVTNLLIIRKLEHT